MKLDLGTLIPVASGWILCVDECDVSCSICVNLPHEFLNLSDKEKLYISLYLTARKTLDYRIAAAMHVYSVKNKVAVGSEVLVKALKEGEIESKIPQALEDVPYAWEAVRWRGIAYAQTFLDVERPVLVKVKPPKDKHLREKLRTLLEGKRVVVKGKVYKVNGLIKKVDGEKIAPWIYLIPKKHIPKLPQHAPQDLIILDYRTS